MLIYIFFVAMGSTCQQEKLSFPQKLDLVYLINKKLTRMSKVLSCSRYPTKNKKK